MKEKVDDYRLATYENKPIIINVNNGSVHEILPEGTNKSYGPSSYLSLLISKDVLLTVPPNIVQSWDSAAKRKAESL